MRFATALVGSSDAADIVSIAVVRTLRGRPLNSLGNPQAYLMKAVLNEARALGRDRARRHRLQERLSETPVLVNSEPADNPDLVAAVRRLPVKQRAAVYLTYWADLDSVAAAEVMGCRPATVRRYLHLARSKLRGFA